MIVSAAAALPQEVAAANVDFDRAGCAAASIVFDDGVVGEIIDIVAFASSVAGIVRVAGTMNAAAVRIVTISITFL